ncbi:MAG TPA: hypothetical protein VKO87_08110, partial [Gemmatimonadaceae bacterium]|nr:hypothetical protein [Gemmatimonadaceae bacterium]
MLKLIHRSAPGIMALATIIGVRAEAQRVSSVGDLRAVIAGARPGSQVVIPAGTYDIGSEPLRIEDKRSVKIIGAG